MYIIEKKVKIMETLSAIQNRYSCRSFNSDQISDEKLEAILKAGMSAPVGMGAYNSMHLTVIKDKDLITKIGDKKLKE